MTAAATPLESLLLTRRDAARMLACSERQISYFAARGDLRPVRLARKAVRFHLDDLKALIRARQEPGAPPSSPSIAGPEPAVHISRDSSQPAGAT